MEDHRIDFHDTKPVCNLILYAQWKMWSKYIKDFEMGKYVQIKINFV